ncbi:MAG: 4a-hydroxytetrahydrobiopterin dehydratase [Bdellovibrionales bacterium]|nr:4a-hydroxytetrahydrobiopterin dehydratase [Bdellovibrionales bacterium]
MVPAAKLTPNQLEIALKQHPDWKFSASGQIEKTFELSGFPQSLLFVNSVGLLAEKQNHHPDILILWNKVRLSLSTHDSGGITQKDFDLAKAVDQLPTI